MFVVLKNTMLLTRILLLCLLIFSLVSINAWKTKNNVRKMLSSGLVSAGLMLSNSAMVSAQDQYRLPPIDRKDPDRCTMTSSAMGQANAARNGLLDLRECDLKGKDAKGKDMSGLIGSDADFSGVNFVEVQISKAYMRNSKFLNCDFTNGVLDRVSFDNSDMKNSIFKNAVLSGTTFSGADLTNTDFTDAYLGPFDLKNLCANPTLKGKNPVTGEDTKESAGCLQE